MVVMVVKVEGEGEAQVGRDLMCWKGDPSWMGWDGVLGDGGIDGGWISAFHTLRCQKFVPQTRVY